MGSSAAYQSNRPSGLHETRLSSPFGYVSRELHETVASGVAAARIPRGGTVLDFGCAASPYRSIFDQSVTYLGADLPGNSAADVELARDGSVPLPDASIDLVLSTQVLEHVEDPARYLRETRRLLRSGGSLMLTTHGMMYYHPDPEDYWRWTSAGLVRLVEEAGLRVDHVAGIVGLIPACLQMIQATTSEKLPRRLRRPYIAAMQLMVSGLDRRLSETSRRHNSLVIALRASRVH